MMKFLNWSGRNLIGLLLLIVLLTLTFAGYSLAQTFLAAPRQITATVILERIQTLSELSTVRYNFSSIITTTRDMPPVLAVLYGENQVMVAVGHVRAGIDLSQMSEDDIVRRENDLSIKLPPPALQDCVLNEKEFLHRLQTDGHICTECARTRACFESIL